MFHVKHLMSPMGRGVFWADKAHSQKPVSFLFHVKHQNKKGRF